LKLIAEQFQQNSKSAILGPWGGAVAKNSTAQNRTENGRIYLPHSSAQPEATAHFRTGKSACQFHWMPIISCNNNGISVSLLGVIGDNWQI